MGGTHPAGQLTGFALEAIGGTRALVCTADGQPIASERDGADLIGEALGADAELIIIPVERLAPDFFRLASGLAGAITQKCVNYRRRLAIVGDVSAHEAASTPFRDYVREANRGRQLWFVPDRKALEARLAA